MNPARGDAAPSRDARMPARVEVDTITPRQRRVVNLLEDRARRCEMLAAFAAAGGLERERAANVLCADLGDSMQSLIVGDLRIEAMEDGVHPAVQLLWKGKSNNQWQKLSFDALRVFARDAMLELRAA